jgi:hypothetical protein
MKKIISLSIFCLFFLSSTIQAKIYKLECKYGKGQIGDGNINYQSTTWYINFDKKKVALGKINNKKVKYVSKTWKSDETNKGLNKNGGILLGNLEMNINGILYLVALGPRDLEGTGNDMIAYAFSPDGVDSDPQHIRYMSQLDKLAKTMGKNKKDYEKYLAVDKERQKIIRKYNITQDCSVPTKIKVGKTKDGESNLTDKIKKSITDLVN